MLQNAVEETDFIHWLYRYINALTNYEGGFKNYVASFKH
jgi:hypothetical protein